MVKIDIDMPLECHECPFQKRFKADTEDLFYNRRCTIENRTIEYPRPSWCPLEECESKVQMIYKIGGIITVHGQSDHKFKLGETILYSPTEIEKILKQHIDEL